MSSWGRLYRVAARSACRPKAIVSAWRSRAIEQDAGGVTADLRRRHARARRPPGRRRRRALHRARAVPAGYRAATTPDTSPGARCWTSATCRRRSARNCSSATRFACRTASCSSPIRCPAATTRPEPGRRAYNIVWYRPTDAASDARRSLHRRDRQAPRHRDPAAADPARGHRRDQGDGARPGRAAGRRDLRARPAAVLPADLRSRTRRRSCSGAWRCSATPPSWRGRMSAPASPRRRWMRRALPTRRRATISSPACSAISARNNPSAAAWWRSDVKKAPISAPSSSRASSARRAELHRDINDVLHAHNSRSENLRSVLVGSRRAS